MSDQNVVEKAGKTGPTHPRTALPGGVPPHMKVNWSAGSMSPQEWAVFAKKTGACPEHGCQKVGGHDGEHRVVLGQEGGRLTPSGTVDKAEPSQPAAPPSGNHPAKPASPPKAPPVQPPAAMGKGQTSPTEPHLRFHEWNAASNDQRQKWLDSGRQLHPQDLDLLDEQIRSEYQNGRAPLAKAEAGGTHVREFIVPIGAGGILRWHAACLRGDDSSKADVVRGRDPDADYSKEAAKALTGRCVGCDGELGMDPEPGREDGAPTHGEEHQEQAVEKAEVFKDYPAARGHAEAQTRQLQQAHGIEAGKEYGRKVYKVHMVPNDPAKRQGFETRLEVLEPKHYPKATTEKAEVSQLSRIAEVEKAELLHPRSLNQMYEAYQAGPLDPRVMADKADAATRATQGSARSQRLGQLHFMAMAAHREAGHAWTTQGGAHGDVARKHYAQAGEHERHARQLLGGSFPMHPTEKAEVLGGARHHYQHLLRAQALGKSDAVTKHASLCAAYSVRAGLVAEGVAELPAAVRDGDGVDLSKAEYPMDREMKKIPNVKAEVTPPSHLVKTGTIEGQAIKASETARRTDDPAHRAAAAKLSRDAAEGARKQGKEHLAGYHESVAKYHEGRAGKPTQKAEGDAPAAPHPDAAKITAHRYVQALREGDLGTMTHYMAQRHGAALKYGGTGDAYSRAVRGAKVISQRGGMPLEDTIEHLKHLHTLHEEATGGDGSGPAQKVECSGKAAWYAERGGGGGDAESMSRKAHASGNPQDHGNAAVAWDMEANDSRRAGNAAIAKQAAAKRDEHRRLASPHQKAEGTPGSATQGDALQKLRSRLAKCGQMSVEKAEATSSGKPVPAADDPIYTERQRAPKWNIAPSGTQHPPHLAQRTRDWSKQDHLEAAQIHSGRAKASQQQHHAAVSTAEAKYGAQGPLISAGLRDHWPKETKDQIRTLAHATTAHSDAAMAHYKLSGKRTPFRPLD